MKTVLVVVTMALFAATAFAETYTWVDDHGTVNFADDLGSVPKKYRKKARIVGEEEPPAAAAEEPAEKVAPVERKQKEGVRGEAPREGTERAPAAKVDMKAVYGGKDALTWKYDFASARANLKAAEDQLVDNRERLKDTSGMSRSEYVSIQNTVKSLELSVVRLRKKLDDLKHDAQGVGVPPELME